MKFDPVSLATISLITGIAGAIAGGTALYLVIRDEHPRGPTYAGHCATDGSQAIYGMTVTVSSGNVTGNLNCVNLSSGGSADGSCFPDFALYTMADGSKKRADELAVGDRVADGRGGTNTVLGVYRVLLGNRLMFRINGAHCTTDEHPHMRPEGGFVSINPNACYGEYDRSYPVEVGPGQFRIMEFVGLAPGMVSQMREGQALLGARGPVKIAKLEICDVAEWPPETVVYNHVLGKVHPDDSGSGTCIVDDIVTTGWPDHTKFDHQAWQPIVAEPVAA